MNKERKSNFELMRIISMFMIIIWHIIIHGNLLNYTQGSINLVLNFILSISIVHVNSFILLHGYFNYNKEFSIKKVISLLNCAIFYSIIIAIIFKKLNLVDFNDIEFLRQFSYIPITQYWFLKFYIFVYCLSPFLNILIKNINKHQFNILLFTSFIIFSILPIVSGNQIINVSNGYSVYSFIFLYLLGAYFRIYPIEELRLFKEKRRTQIILLFSIIMFAVLNLSLLFLSEYLETIENDIIITLANNMKASFMAYNNPIVILQTVCYFLFFSTINLKSKFINKISKGIFGVYLIHDNNLVRGRLYNWLGINRGVMIYDSSIIIYCFLCAILILIVCLFIEFIRYLLFKLISTRKTIVNSF